MSQSYTLAFLPLSFIAEEDIEFIDNGIAGPYGNNENDLSASRRKGGTFETSEYDETAYVTALVHDDDGILQDVPEPGTQVLGSDLIVNGKTYPAGTEIHTGYRLDLSMDGSSKAALSIYSINITTADGEIRTIGLASSDPIPPNTTFRVVGGANNTPISNAGDLQNPDEMYCFAAGTMIATPEGPVAVEDLAIGDPIMTADGQVVPVRWIGRQTMHKMFAPRHRFEPVRIAAGALGGGIPHEDLILTADHALVLDGFAINAGALVNGGSVARIPHAALPERVTYYHVETDRHDVILANGVPAETFLDQGDRRQFDNYAEYIALYGSDRVLAEMPLPRIGSARMVPPSLRARLAAASGDPAPQRAMRD